MGTRGSDDLFGDDCDKVGWTAGEQYGTTIKVWVEIVDENGNPVQDNSYESLMASASVVTKPQKIPGNAPGDDFTEEKVKM